MKIKLVRYCYVEPTGAPPTTFETSVSSDLTEYFAEQLEFLRAAATRDRTPPAEFIETTAAARCDRLRAGTTAHFEAAFREYVTALYAKWDKRAKQGFLVALRAQADKEAVGALLKLDLQDNDVAAVMS